MPLNTPETDFSFGGMIQQFRQMCTEFELIKTPTNNVGELLVSLQTLSTRFVAFRFLLIQHRPTLNPNQISICIGVLNLIGETISLLNLKQEEGNNHLKDLLQEFKSTLHTQEQIMADFISMYYNQQKL